MDKAYLDWIQGLKAKIPSAQIKASIAVNQEMLMLYWDIGKSIVEKQNQFGWGSKIVEQMAKDLKRELPDTNGFSRTNLFAMRKFYLFYKDTELVHQLGGQLENTSTNREHELVQQVAGQLLKTEQDNPSIGIILCKSKDGLEVEYALQDLNKPMGISEFTFNELPQNIKSNMPTVQEFENELNKNNIS